MDSPTSSSASSSSRPPSPPYLPPHARDITFDANAAAGPSSRTHPHHSAASRPHSLFSQPTPPSAAYALAQAAAQPGTSYSSATSGALHAGSLSRKSSARSRGKGAGGSSRFWFGGGGGGSGAGTRSGSATEDDVSEHDYVPPPDDVKETPTLLKTKDEATGKSLVNQYLILDELGRGQHGKVRLAMDVHDGSYWAIKIINRKAKKKLAAFSSTAGGGGRAESAQLQKENKLRKEIAILKKLRHPNVVRLREVIDAASSKYIFLVFEYMEGGEVKWRTTDERPILTTEQTRRTFRDIVLGLEYLHHQGIIHRDIKPANLLWSADHATVKITDFGVSHHSKFLERAAAEADADDGGPDGGGGHEGSSGFSAGLLTGGDTPNAGSGAGSGLLSRTTSAAPSRAGERYDDDDEAELAKTAGSPAFFAPELCYGGDSTPVATTPLGSPPPVDDATASFDRAAAQAGGSASFFARFAQARPGLAQLRSASTSAVSPSRPPARPHSQASSSTQHFSGGAPSPLTSSRRPKITKAIDVWALGVTLYCLLFARVPFEAHSEFALFGVIPFDDYRVPSECGADAFATGGRQWAASDEARELGDLLDRLLEKDPARRIKLDEVKRHPWVLRGIDNVHDWLARTDPTHDTFVTVTRDEVARALTETFSAKVKRTASRIRQKLFPSSSASSVRSRADSLSPRSSGAQSGMLSSKHSFLHALRAAHHKDKGDPRDGGGGLVSGQLTPHQPPAMTDMSVAHDHRPSPSAPLSPPLPACSPATSSPSAPRQDPTFLSPTTASGLSPPKTGALSGGGGNGDHYHTHADVGRLSSASSLLSASSTRARSPLGSRPPSLVPPRRRPADRAPSSSAATTDAYEDADEDDVGDSDDEARLAALGDDEHDGAGDDDDEEDDEDEGLALEFGKNRRRQPAPAPAPPQPPKRHQLEVLALPPF